MHLFGCDLGAQKSLDSFLHHSQARDVVPGAVLSRIRSWSLEFVCPSSGHSTIPWISVCAHNELEKLLQEQKGGNAAEVGATKCVI